MTLETPALSKSKLRSSEKSSRFESMFFRRKWMTLSRLDKLGRTPGTRMPITGNPKTKPL